MAKRFEKKLTHDLIEALNGNEDIKVKDTEVKGFYIWYYAKTGLKVFYIRYRTLNTKVERNIRIGRYPEFKIKEARDVAEDYKHRVARGGDPILDKELELEELKKKQEENKKEVKKQIKVKDLLEIYLEEHTKKYNAQTTYKNACGMVNKYINPAFGDISIIDINEDHISKLHTEIGKKFKIQANRCRALLSNFLNWCETKKYRDKHTNPVEDVEKYKEEGRERNTSDDEYVRIFNALSIARQMNIYSEQSFDAIEVIMLTGCRSKEVKTLQWSDIDFTNSFFRLRTSKTGKKSVPVGEAIMNKLKEIKQKRELSKDGISDYVFPSPLNPNKPISDLRRPWNQILDLAKIKKTKEEKLRIHDLRHSFTTIGCMTGEDMSIISKVLGHSQITTTQRYLHTNNQRVVQAATFVSNKILEKAQKKLEPVVVNN